MPQELIYTSARKGLKLGSRGFCTVASTSGMAKSLADRLESLSGYKHVFSPGDPQVHLNPVNFSHVIIRVGGQQYHVLSRVADAGLDYTQRTNKLAHHVALEPVELVSAGPAWLLAQSGFMEARWDGEPRLLGAGRSLPQGELEPGVCRTWESITGDAGWGGYLAQTMASGGAAFIIFRPGMDLLPLILEAQALLTPEQRWKATFSTYFTRLPPGADCRWRCILEGTPEARVAERSDGGAVIDLSRDMGAPPVGRLVNAARSGVVPPSNSGHVSVTAASPPANVSLDDASEPATVEHTPRLGEGEPEVLPPVRKRTPKQSRVAGRTRPPVRSDQRRRDTWWKLVVATAGLVLLMGVGVGVYVVIGFDGPSVPRPVAQITTKPTSIGNGQRQPVLANEAPTSPTETTGAPAHNSKTAEDTPPTIDDELPDQQKSTRADVPDVNHISGTLDSIDEKLERMSLVLDALIKSQKELEELASSTETASDLQVIYDHLTHLRDRCDDLRIAKNAWHAAFNHDTPSHDVNDVEELLHVLPEPMRSDYYERLEALRIRIDHLNSRTKQIIDPDEYYNRIERDLQHRLAPRFVDVVRLPPTPITANRRMVIGWLPHNSGSESIDLEVKWIASAHPPPAKVHPGPGRDEWSLKNAGESDALILINWRNSWLMAEWGPRADRGTYTTLGDSFLRIGYTPKGLMHPEIGSNTPSPVSDRTRRNEWLIPLFAIRDSAEPLRFEKGEVSGHWPIDSDLAPPSINEALAKIRVEGVADATVQKTVHGDDRIQLVFTDIPSLTCDIYLDVRPELRINARIEFDDSVVNHALRDYLATRASLEEADREQYRIVRRALEQSLGEEVHDEKVRKAIESGDLPWASMTRASINTLQQKQKEINKMLGKLAGYPEKFDEVVSRISNEFALHVRIYRIVKVPASATNVPALIYGAGEFPLLDD